MNPASEFRVQFRSVSDLIPYARNSRTHSDEQVLQLAASISEFGFTNPVLADAEGIVAGHGRVMAARKLMDAGKTLRLPSGAPIPDGCVPVIDCTGWSPAQRRAYVIADNKLALNSGWDSAMLASELQELSALDFDLDAIGFSEAELQQVLLPIEQGETDAAAAWKGMPEYEDGAPCFRKVVVNFDDAGAVADFFKLIGQSYTDKTKSIWHPWKPDRDLASQQWGDDGAASEVADE